MSKPIHKLPPVDQMPEKTKLAALRDQMMLAKYGAAKVIKLIGVKNETREKDFH